MVTEKFKEMALSFAGCDGGNPRSEIWFCGLEWGDTLKRDNAHKIQHEFAPQRVPTSWADEDFEDSWVAGYNQKLCWFLEYFYGIQRDGRLNQAYITEQQMFQPNGRGFKLNMLPVRFGNRGSIVWDEEIIAATGFASFDEYRRWCVEHRGKFFQSLMAEHKPRVIVCTGKDDRNFFFEFFTNEACYEEYVCEDFSFLWCWHGDTLVCVSPFFGWRNFSINSEPKMEQLVKAIRQLLEQPAKAA